MSVEICIPAFNEERIIADAARAVLRVFREVKREAVITVSDNASTDGTARVAGTVGGVSVVSIPTRGKGAAVVAAARRSTADFFGFIDADLSADPADLISLLSLVESGECDIAIGSRFADTRIVDRGILRTFPSLVFKILQKLIVGIKVGDTQCGLKVMNERSKRLLAQCEETGWFFDMEFLARAEYRGLRIREVPIHWQEHRFAGRESKLNHVRDGFKALFAMFRIRRAMQRASVPSGK